MGEVYRADDLILDQPVALKFLPSGADHQSGLDAMPMTLQFSHWRAEASNWTLVLLIGLTLFGFYASRAGQPLFGSILEER